MCASAGPDGWRGITVRVAQALVGLDPDGSSVEWAGWDAFSLMLKLGASCESTYVGRG
jgi:hypothetical protein